MAEGRQHDQWWHTAHLICAIAEPQRDPEKRRLPYEPIDFYPFRHLLPAAERRRGIAGDINCLKAFVKG